MYDSLLPVCYGKSKKKMKLHLGNCVVPVLSSLPAFIIFKERGGKLGPRVS